MSETFVISDTHIDHYKIALICNREQFIVDNPDFDSTKPVNMKTNWPKKVLLQAHNEYIVDTWNRDASRYDKIWILGDLAWKNHTHWIHRLNGKKFFIRGNHDKMNQDALTLFQKLDGSHYQYSYYTKINKHGVMFSHCPYSSWFSSCHGSWNLHGHCHGRRKEVPWILSCDCSWDVWGRLIPWEVLEAKMLDKEKIRRARMTDDSRIESGESEINFQQNILLNSRYMNGERDILTDMEV